MPRLLPETEIADLLAEQKPLPGNWRTRLAVKQKADQTFRQRDLELKGQQGHTFKLILRSNVLNPLDFSIVLVFVDDDGTQYRLVRYNGRHPSQHTNKWEKIRQLSNAAFRNRFHIHRATERYQMEGLEIDGYAEVTESYDSFESALEEFVKSNGLIVPEATGSDDPTLPWELAKESGE